MQPDGIINPTMKPFSRNSAAAAAEPLQPFCRNWPELEPETVELVITGGGGRKVGEEWGGASPCHVTFNNKTNYPSSSPPSPPLRVSMTTTVLLAVASQHWCTRALDTWTRSRLSSTYAATPQSKQLYAQHTNQPVTISVVRQRGLPTEGALYGDTFSCWTASLIALFWKLKISSKQFMSKPKR